MNQPVVTIVYSRRFDRDLGETLRFLRREASERAASKVRDAVFEAIESLFEHPERYPPEPRLSHLGNYRVIRLRKLPYKIFYKYHEPAIRIERMFHSKRDFERVFRRFKF
jgi:plasmid stabilization system protein ParE